MKSISNSLKRIGKASEPARPHPQPPKDSERVRILFLAANPRDSTPLRLGEEVRTIQQTLDATPLRGRIELIQAWALRISDLQSRLLTHNPHIVHFSGHGNEEGLTLEDDTGHRHVIGAASLGRLFSLLGDNTACVVLNACYSERQASAICDATGCVVGMGHIVKDQAAIAFAGAFYQALGHGQSLQQAFDLGALQLGLRDERATPRLLSRRGTNPDRLFPVTASASLDDSPAPGSTPSGLLFAASPLPTSLGERFHGREDALTALRHRFVEREHHGPSTICIEGQPGVGKTRLALEFVWRHRSDFPGGIFWLDARSPAHPQLRDLLRALRPDQPGLTEATDAEIPSLLRETLKGHRPNQRKLMVLDGLSAPKPQAARLDLSMWCPARDEINLLLTGHSTIADRGIEAHRLGPLSLNDAQRILSEGLSTAPPDHHALRWLAASVGGLPLALEILHHGLDLGAVSHRAPYSDFLDTEAATKLEEIRLAVLSLAPQGALTGYKDALAPILDGLSDDARRLAHTLAWLCPAPIHTGLVATLSATRLTPLQLTSRHILRRHNDPSTFTMPPLMASHLRALDNDQSARRRATNALLTALEAHTNHPALTRSATALLGLTPRDSPESIQLRLALVSMATPSHPRDHGALLALLSRCVADAHRVLGEDHPTTLDAQHQLAISQHAIGDLEAACTTLQTVVNARKGRLGAKHSDTSTAQWDLLHILRKQGDHDRAQTLRGALLWLLIADDDQLTPDQRTIRTQLA